MQRFLQIRNLKSLILVVLLGRVLTEMRLVKVSNTERLELDNAHINLKDLQSWLKAG